MRRFLAEPANAIAVVAVLNGVMAAVEGAAAVPAESAALAADALDFLEDAATAGLAIWALAGSAMRRRRVAFVQGAVMIALGLGVALAALVRLYVGSAPAPIAMGGIGALALLVNLSCAAIMLRHRNGEANVRAVWLSGRNDAVGNLAVIAAGVAVALTGSNIPDIVVGVAVAGLFVSAGIDVLARARAERA